ncbi:MAG: hypothetical protein VXW65_10665, partial [Pseudomonadota bacterium]|nr:hypothetical protein [Pseudomonadota bacterium]
MGSVKAVEFQAHCLALLEEVERTGQSLILIQDGKPAVEIRPIQPVHAASVVGLTAGPCHIEGGSVEPAIGSHAGTGLLER